MTKIQVDETTMKMHIKDVQAKTRDLLQSTNKLELNFKKNVLQSNNLLVQDIEKIKKVLVDYAQILENDLNQFAKDLKIVVDVDLEISKNIQTTIVERGGF